MTLHRLNSPSLRVRSARNNRPSGGPPVFSIVLPTYNRPELLRRAIASVYQQTFQDFELIVVDDGSPTSCDSALPDPTDARVRVIRNPGNMGVAGSRNVGIEAARGAYISFIDDDDEYRSTFLASTYARLKDTPASTGVSWCSVEYIRYAKEPAGTQRREAREFATEHPTKCALFQEFLSIGMGFGVTFKALCLKKVGRFKSRLKVGSDTNFFFRILSQGFVPIVVPGIHVTIHDHRMARLSTPTMITERIRGWEEILYEYSEFMDEYPPIRADFLRLLDRRKLECERNEKARAVQHVPDLHDGSTRPTGLES